MSAVSAVIRKARASDREDILDISSKIWGGHDYLPSVIDGWLKSPKCHTYGVEADHRLVAIGNLRLVDRNKTGWMEGLRVHPDHQKRGYADMLTKHFLSLGETLNVQRLRYTTGGNNRASLKLARKAGFKRLFKVSAFWYEDLKATAKPTGTRRSIVEATPQEAHALLGTSLSLVPHNILIYDWKAVNGTLHGFKETGKDHHFYVTNRRGKLEVFSFGHAIPDSQHDRWSFTVYALREKDLVAHFHHHLETALSKGLSATVCTCPTQFESTLKERKGLPKFRWKIQLIMLEKQLRPDTQG